MLEIAGEPGIGKTRLLAEIGRLAGRRGYQVVGGRAGEYEQAVAFGVFADPLDEHLRGLAQPRRAAVLAGLAPALLGLHTWTPDAPGAVASLEVLRAVRLAIERLAARTPLVLLLDDLHWADHASTGLLRYLLRRPPRAAVLFALAYRPAQAASGLLAALSEAAERDMRVELGPLSMAEADELLRAARTPAPPRARRRACYVESGGNPFYLLALAELDPSAAIPPVEADAARLAGLPPALRRLVGAEFAGLSAAATMTASAAAVAGDTFDLDLVARVAGTPPGAGFGEIVARDLVRPAAGGCFSFRHPLLRHAAYHLAPPEWRLAAHRRAAAVAAERGLPAAARAPHVERYAAPGDLDAIEVLMSAARAETTRAPAIAAYWLRAALRLLPEPPLGQGGGRTRREELMVALAHAQGIAGELAASRATVHEVLPHLPAGGPSRISAVTFAAMVERLLGHHAPARALLLTELARCCGEASSAARAELALELAVGALMRGDLSENRRWARRALAWAAPSDRGVRATALGFLAMCAFADFDVRGALARLNTAAGLVDAMPDGELAGQLGATVWLGWNEVYLERYLDAVRHLERGLAIARGSGQVYLLPLLLSCLCLARRWLGELARASEHAEEAVDAADLTGSTDLSALALAVRSWVATWVGDIALARAAARDAVRAGRGQRGWFAALASAMLARSELHAGKANGSADAIIDAFGGPDLPAADPRSRISWWVVVVRSELARGRPDVAAQYAARAEALAARIGLAGHQANARLARAQVLLADADPTGVPLALAAAEAFASAGCPLDEGQAYLLAGAFLVKAASGEDRTKGTQARDYLARAGLLLSACGARGLAAEAASLAEAIESGGPLQTRASGQPPVPAPAGPCGPGETGGPTGLTRREAQTATLVAEGITNREIARRLGISEKTVEKHVSSLLAKLGVAGRAGVALRVGRGEVATARPPTQPGAPAADRDDPPGGVAGAGLNPATPR